MDVLDNDVLGVTSDIQTLASDDSLVPDTDDGLVASDFHTASTGVIPGGGNALFVRIAAILDGVLTTVVSTTSFGRSAGMARSRAFGILEVELAIDQDDSRCAVGQPSLQPFGPCVSCGCKISVVQGTH